jgi:hypothetical protein
MSEAYQYKCTKCTATNVVAYSKDGSIQHCFVCKAIYNADKNPQGVKTGNIRKNVMDSLPLHKKRVGKA